MCCMLTQNFALNFEYNDFEISEKYIFNQRFFTQSNIKTKFETIIMLDLIYLYMNDRKNEGCVGAWTGTLTKGLWR